MVDSGGMFADIQHENSDLELLLFGTEDGRALNKMTVKLSAASFTVPNEKDFHACIESLRQFAVVLRGRDANDVHYGWDKVFVNRKSRLVTFKILWYDSAFFEARKLAYKSKMHSDVLQRFNVSIADLHVSHL